MFTIYHSNQLDLLKSLTAQLMSHQPTNSIFEKEIVLIQSPGMEQWLQIQLASELGISANIAYPFPNQFIWDIYRQFYTNLPKENIFNHDFMTWALLSILPKLAKSSEFSMLSHYVDNLDHHDNEQKYYQLANVIAGLFDQYLIYRPDWIKTWEKGELVEGLNKSQEWQAILWRELVVYAKQLDGTFLHRADIHQTVVQALNENKISRAQIARLPTRVFIFSIVALPPLYLELFHALSQYMDVHVMFMNPCKQYWGDIVDHSFLTKYGNNEQLEAMIQESNPLLASWGKLGRDHLALLQNYNDKRDIEAFVDYEQSTLLTQLQQSILYMQNEAIKLEDATSLNNSEQKHVIYARDDSISFHACHSEQREVEVLYDYLLFVLDNNLDITLNDCVVMVADIDHYAPYIQAVFDNAPKSRYLPYTISDQKLRNIDPIIQGFFWLLELPQSRLEIEFIFDLLAIPAIAKQFELNDEKLKRLQHWIVDSGIRWGLESDIEKPHSWLSGLNRMLLGYTMESQFDSWQDILPYEGSTGLEAELVGVFSDFIMAIAKWRNILSQQHTIKDWQILCSELLTDFFAIDANSESLLFTIEEQWQSIIKQALIAHYDESIGVAILKNLIQTKFDNHVLSHRFLIGKINFCTMMPMRSVPFKVVCLLGMNDGVYPRTVLPLGFDLISHHWRIGDRSRRNDDRYLFLEALLSAEQKLYISYIGRDIQTNDARYPSILVDELLNYLQQSYVLSGDELLDVEQSAKKLCQYLIYSHTRTPFNINNYLIESKHKSVNYLSYVEEWLPAAKKQGQQCNFIEQLEPISIQSIAIDDLKRFYLHSISEFTKKRLGYLINYVDDQLPDAENFNLNNLQKYTVNNQIIDGFMFTTYPQNELSSKLYQSLQRSNQLPYGAFGQILYHEQEEAMQELFNRINAEKQTDFLSLEIDYPIQGVQLTGRLNNILPDGILQWRTTKLTVKDAMSLWIDHLIFCLHQSESSDFESRIYGREGAEWRFKSIPSEQAQLFLSQLVDGYLLGMNQPIFMPLKCAWEWLNVAYDKNTAAITKDSYVLFRAKQKFVNRWQGGIGISPECDDYYLRLYYDLSDELIDHAIKSIKVYLLPIMKQLFNNSLNSGGES